MDTTLAGQALDNLVTQFSSALDCLRELVQNAMDAGSPQVDVWFELEPPEAGGGGEGVIAIHVDDYGTGMDEAVIDNELTQLFASSKEDDLTKIGKFGIGFVSIFALGPQAVLLHTGRGGEYWEVLFNADRSFTKARVETPVEGTQITLFLTGDETRYLHLFDEGRATLKRWCRHSDVEITLEDRSGLSGGPAAAGPEVVNEPFTLDGLVAARVEEDGAEMALAYDLKPRFAFFNKGLTLAELSDPDEVPPRFRNVSFKIKSRYLEHTLSRETVMRDENYEKAMRLLERAADGPLHQALLAALEEVVALPAWGLAEEQRYQRLAAYLLLEPEEALRAAGRRPLLRTVEGGRTSLAEVADAARRDGRIWITDAPSDLTVELSREGTPVLFSRVRPMGTGWVPSGKAAEAGDAPEAGGGLEASEEPGASDALAPEAGGAPGSDAVTEPAPEAGGAPRKPALDPALRLATAFVADRERGRILHRLLHVLTQTDYGAKVASLLARPEDVFWAVRVETTLPEAEAALLGRAGELLARVGADYRRLAGCVLGAPAAEPPLFLVARRLGTRMAIPPPLVVEPERPRRPEAAVNRHHPQYQALVRLHQRAPGLAAYCLAKGLLLSEDRMLERDLELLGLALGEAGGTP